MAVLSDDMCEYPNFADEAWGMADLEGIPMSSMCSDSAYRMNDYGENRGATDNSYYPSVEALEQQFQEPIGQVEPAGVIAQPMRQWEPETHHPVPEMRQQQQWAQPHVNFHDSNIPQMLRNHESSAYATHHYESVNRNVYRSYETPSAAISYRTMSEQRSMWNAPQQLPYRAQYSRPIEDDAQPPLAPTSPQEHVSHIPTGVYEEAAPQPHLSPRQNVAEMQRPSERRRARHVPTDDVQMNSSAQHGPRRVSSGVATASVGPVSPMTTAAERSKRGRVRAQLDFALLHKGPPLPKGVAMLPVSVTVASAPAPVSTPVKPSPSKRRRVAPAPAAANSMTTPAAVAPASVRQALGGPVPSNASINSNAAVSGNATLLAACKFVSKRTCAECTGVPRLATHKRGYLACACSQGHQWVWCVKCCSCPRPNGSKSRGCTNPGHWFERDAFDTGRRNHMNRHQDK